MASFVNIHELFRQSVLADGWVHKDMNDLGRVSRS